MTSPQLPLRHCNNHHHHHHHHHHHGHKDKHEFKTWTKATIRRLAKCSIAHLALLVFLSIACVHRLCANYEGHRIFVHAPIHTLPRVCPEPSYETLSAQDEPPKICLTTLTDEKHHHWLHKLIRWRDFDGLLELTWQNKLDYANKHGYSLFDESANVDITRPPSWSKIKAVKRLLVEENCTWVWWLDADTVIMNSEKRVEDFLPASDAPQDLLLSQDHSGYNAGGWLIRNSPYSLEFLDEWWNKREFVKPFGLATSGDNDAFKNILATLPEFGQHILVPPRCTFNSFAYFVTEQVLADVTSQPEGSEGSLTKQEWYLNEAYYHKGDLLAHIAGFNNKVHPIQMLLDLAE